MNKHINKNIIPKFDWQKYFVNLFDNPLGRLYLGIPKGKHIYKITKSSAHYYTGEIAENGLPIICTGDCFSGGKNIENKILKLSKVISCIAFLPFLPKVLLPLIALTDTGVKAPSATGRKYNTWTNPSYAYADDNNYATRRNVVAGKQSYENFGFSITDGSTINGIEVSVKGKVDVGDAPVGFNVYNYGSTSWATEYLGAYGVGGIWDSTEKTITYGSSSYLWGKSWAVSDFSDTNFSAYITTVSGRGNIYMLNLITVKVYYTEPVVAPTVTTQSATNIAQTSCTGNGNITDTGGENCTRRGFCYMVAETENLDSTESPDTMGLEDYTKGDVNWSNPDNAKVSDDTYATVTLSSQRSHYLKATNFGFNIPSNATITSIIPIIEAKTASGEVYISTNVVRAGTILTTISYWVAFNTTESTQNVATGLWFSSWTPSDINNSGFGVAVSIRQDSTDTISVDSIKIKVEYSIPDGGTPDTSDSVVYDDGSFSTGAFNKSITGLTPNTSYRVRAYAVNSAGTSYGTTVDVKTLSAFIPRTMWFN